MRGRKRKPAAIRRLQGKPGHRPIPDEPEFAANLPPAPPYLKGDGLSEWIRLGARATELGVTTEADWAVFAAYCFAWQRSCEFARALVKERPGTVERARLESAYDRTSKQLMKAITELGFSPVTRSKVDARKIEKVRDPFEVFEGGKAKAEK